MRKLLLKSCRDLLRMKVRVVSIWLLVSVVVFVYAGEFMARESLYHTRDTLCEQLHFADLEVVFTAASPDEMPDLRDLEKEAWISRRMLSPGVMELKDGKPLACLVIYTDPSGRPPVNDIRIIEGRNLSPEDENGVVIEKSLAEIHGYRIGDTITIGPAIPLEVTVRGIAVSPECMVSPANPMILIPSKGSLGIIFASMKIVEKAFGYPLYNSLCFLMHDPAGRETFELGIMDRLKPLEIERLVPRERQFGYRFLSQDLKGFSIMIGPVVGIFCVITAIVIILTITRLIVSQRKQIGVVMALGYSARAIAFSYLLMGAVFGAGGAVLGVALSFPVNSLYSDTYARIVGMPEVIYKTSWLYIVLGVLLGVSLALGATAVPLLRLRRLSPQVVIREEPETAATGLLARLRLLERFVGLFSGPSMARKIGFRNLLRRPRLTMATVLLIALAVSLSMTFQISMSSLDHHAETQFETESWDVMAGFRSALDVADAEDVIRQAGIADYELSLTGFGRLHIGDAYEDFRIVGVSPEYRFRSAHIKAGRVFTGDKERSILYNNSLADRKLNVGDRVILETTRGKFDMEVAGLVEEYTFGQIYMPTGTAEEVLGMQGKRRGFLAAFPGDPHAMKRKLFENELVDHVTLKVDLVRVVRELLATGKAILRISLGISLGISMLFLFTAVTVNILDRQREYATLQSLGLPDRSMIGSVFLELVVEAVAALLLSIPISIGLAHFLNRQFSALWPAVETYVRVQDFLMIMIPAILVLPLAALPGIRFLLKMEIPEVLRSRAFG